MLWKARESVNVYREKGIIFVGQKPEDGKRKGKRETAWRCGLVEFAAPRRGPADGVAA